MSTEINNTLNLAGAVHTELTALFAAKQNKAASNPSKSQSTALASAIPKLNTNPPQMDRQVAVVTVTPAVSQNGPSTALVPASSTAIASTAVVPSSLNIKVVAREEMPAAIKKLTSDLQSFWIIKHEAYPMKEEVGGKSVPDHDQATPLQRAQLNALTIARNINKSTTEAEADQLLEQLQLAILKVFAEKTDQKNEGSVPHLYALIQKMAQTAKPTIGNAKLLKFIADAVRNNNPIQTQAAPQKADSNNNRTAFNLLKILAVGAFVLTTFFLGLNTTISNMNSVQPNFRGGPLTETSKDFTLVPTAPNFVLVNPDEVFDFNEEDYEQPKVDTEEETVRNPLAYDEFNEVTNALTTMEMAVEINEEIELPDANEIDHLDEETNDFTGFKAAPVETEETGWLGTVGKVLLAIPAAGAGIIFNRY